MNINNNYNPNFVPFDVYYPKLQDMTKEQIFFYNYFKSEISKKNRIDIQDSKSYIYLLASEYLDYLYVKGVAGAKKTTLLNVKKGNMKRE